MMTVTLTCPQCGSGVHVYPTAEATNTECSVCQHVIPLSFNDDHLKGIVSDCPCCSRKDFYQQKDFNRKIGVALFVIAAILSIFTYGISLIVLYLMDLFLFRRLGSVVVCYKCNTIFRGAQNIKEIAGFDHEMNDRIVYADHDFQGKNITH
jgi:uncharacterized paraquat-inducible protein A